MAIVRKYINSRADFFRVLGELMKQTKDLVRQNPTYPPFENIDMQLDAIARWTANGRDPTKDERQQVSIGKLVVRELEPAGTDEMYEYTQKLHELNGYFKEWLSDDELADFDEDDWRNDFDD